jgi:hypothetical protein
MLIRLMTKAGNQHFTPAAARHFTLHARAHRGRAKVVDWLKMIENGTTASADCNNETTNYSFDWLWAELGVVDRGGDDPLVPGTRAHDRTIQSLLVSYHEDGAEYFGRHRSLLDRGEGAPYQTN